MNTDATDFVLPNSERQTQCMHMALKRAGINADDIDIVSTHATGTGMGDVLEVAAVRNVFGKSKSTHVNNAKSFIGHTMGAAGALELAGNLVSFEDGVVHPTINLDEFDPECQMDQIVGNEPREIGPVNYVLNNSFGMLGINSALVVKKM